MCLFPQTVLGLFEERGSGWLHAGDRQLDGGRAGRPGHCDSDGAAGIKDYAGAAEVLNKVLNALKKASGSESSHSTAEVLAVAVPRAARVSGSCIASCESW